MDDKVFLREGVDGFWSQSGEERESLVKCLAKTEQKFENQRQPPRTCGNNHNTIFLLPEYAKLFAGEFPQRNNDEAETI